MLGLEDCLRSRKTWCETTMNDNLISRDSDDDWSRETIKISSLSLSVFSFKHGRKEVLDLVLLQ